jgi:hypothetical protein
MTIERIERRVRVLLWMTGVLLALTLVLFWGVWSLSDRVLE